MDWVNQRNYFCVVPLYDFMESSLVSAASTILAIGLSLKKIEKDAVQMLQAAWLLFRKVLHAAQFHSMQRNASKP